MQIGNQKYPWIDAVPGFKIPEYNTIEMGYTGEDLTTVIYKNNGVVVCTLTLGYTNGKLTSVTQAL